MHDAVYDADDSGARIREIVGQMLSPAPRPSRRAIARDHNEPIDWPVWIDNWFTAIKLRAEKSRQP